MEAKGKKFLRICGFLEVVFGVTMIAFIMYALGQDEASSAQIFGLHPTASTFLQIAGAYLQAGLQLLAGIIGILFAASPKHYKICKTFGMLLILIVVINFANAPLSISTSITQFIATIVPILYYYGAAKNQQSQ